MLTRIVLVSLIQGISRGGSLLIAYIMQKHQLPYSEALRVVQLRRFCVSPNEGFSAQLIEFEAIYKAQMTMQQGGVAGLDRTYFV